MGQVRDPKAGDDLQHALEAAAAAAEHDPDEADIAADDAGGTRLAETLGDDDADAEDEAQAHPS
jgi:hypothetical protein